jgi:hypothetical protein
MKQLEERQTTEELRLKQLEPKSSVCAAELGK